MKKNARIKLISCMSLVLLLWTLALGWLTPAPVLGARPEGSLNVYLPLVWKPLVLTAPIKIAILAPMTGPVASFGQSAKNGAQMAIDEWTARNVISPGITIVVEDSQCNATVAAAAANKVIDQDHVKYILGEVCSGASIPIAEIANTKHVLQISPVSTNPQVTVDSGGVTRDYVFRACFIDPFQGYVGAKFARTSLSAAKAYILFDPTCLYCKGLADSFESAFIGAGGTIATKQTYTTGTTDFGTILDQVITANPDVIYLPAFSGDVNLVTTQARAKNITKPFIGGDSWEDNNLNKISTDGSYFTSHFSAENTLPAVQDFVNRYKAKYAGATPDAIAALSYDAANLLLAAITKAGVDDPAVVKNTLAGITFNGVTGQIVFDASHNPTKPGVVMTITGGAIHFHSVINP
jgi:branched-chain amino acid transport system substrate-binding protein